MRKCNINSIKALAIWILLTFKVLKNPWVFCITPTTLGFAALLALWGEPCEESKLQSLQLNSDADLLRCLRSDVHFESKLRRDRSGREFKEYYLLCCKLRLSFWHVAKFLPSSWSNIISLKSMRMKNFLHGVVL